ncbi:MAG: response regulator [Candidatus Falkowbacteria bacterium]
MAKKESLKICIVDDESLIIDMYRIKFEANGFKVVSAVDGAEGFKIIERERPDLALIDIIMPHNDGFQLIEKLKNNKVLRKISIIVLTNLDGQEIREKASRLGVLFFLVKPHFLPSQVVKIVKEALAAKKGDYTA